MIDLANFLIHLYLRRLYNTLHTYTLSSCWTVSYCFSSFEAGIANAISSFIWRELLLCMENKHVPIWVIILTVDLPQNISSITVPLDFLKNGPSTTRVNRFIVL